MKKTLLLTLVFIAKFGLSQDSPQLQLVGSGLSFQKGNINTEVLTEIIQQKQEEIKVKLFRNTIVNHFNKSDNLKSINNFTTYHYIYSIMDIVTSGKNKTVITNSLVESSTEFSYIYGFAIFYSLKNNMEFLKSTSTLKDKGNDIYNKRYFAIDIPDSNSYNNFNLILDICYEILLKKQDELDFKFKETFSSVHFKDWYENDNYYLEMINNKGDDSTKAKKMYDEIEASFLDFKSLLKTGKINDKDKLIESLNILVKSDEIKEQIKFYIDNLDQFGKFFKNLEKNKFKEFVISKEQYYSMKFILNDFIDVIKNRTQNDGVASVLEYLIENTIIEYADNKGLKISEDIANDLTKDNVNGYLFIDIESLLFSLVEKFSEVSNQGFRVYVTPYFNIGTNYSTFIRTNSLNSINDPDKPSLSNMYFASEKIGLKWKLYNWEYTRSFKSGQNFRYFNFINIFLPWKWNNHFNPNRTWLRPQQKPIINNIHLIAYGSGLLYNITNLNSNKNFDYAIIGTGVGVTFFSGLSLSIGVACPYTDRQFKKENQFVNIGLDIPIIEYITAIRKKK